MPHTEIGSVNLSTAATETRRVERQTGIHFGGKRNIYSLAKRSGFVLDELWASPQAEAKMPSS